MLSSISLQALSISFGPFAFNNSVPAIAYSRPGADILIPIAPLIY